MAELSPDVLYEIDPKKWEVACIEQPHLFFIYSHRKKTPVPAPSKIILKRCSLGVLIENLNKYKNKMRNFVIIDFMDTDLPQLLASVAVSGAKVAISNTIAQQYMHEFYDFSLECYGHSSSVMFELFRNKKYLKKITPELRAQYVAYFSCA